MRRFASALALGAIAVFLLAGGQAAGTVQHYEAVVGSTTTKADVTICLRNLASSKYKEEAENREGQAASEVVIKGFYKTKSKARVAARAARRAGHCTLPEAAKAELEE
jgi:hypothetical protein